MFTGIWAIAIAAGLLPLALAAISVTFTLWGLSLMLRIKRATIVFCTYITEGYRGICSLVRNPHPSLVFVAIPDTPADIALPITPVAV